MHVIDEHGDIDHGKVNVDTLNNFPVEVIEHYYQIMPQSLKDYLPQSLRH